MGNCLRARRRAVNPVLMTDESSPVAIGQNQPLSTAPESWSTQVPMTDGQLRGKRDTFWETAPAYDGRKEIWDALKAACEAVEDGDHGLAQAILDSANISLPTGRLVEAYDELGNRYVVPKYCISRPTNMVGTESAQQRGRLDSTENEDTDSTTNLLHDTSPSPPGHRTSATTTTASSGLRSRGSSTASRGGKSKKTKTKSSRHLGPPSPTIDIVPIGDPFVVKIRLSTISKDIKMTLQASDRVKDVKRRLELEQDVPASRITMLYSGRVLNDRTYLKNLDIPRGFLIQAIVT